MKKTLIGFIIVILIQLSNLLHQLQAFSTNAPKFGKRMNDEVQSSDSDHQLVAKTENSVRWFTRIKIVTTSINLFVRLTASFVAAACDGWLRKQRSIARKLKELLVSPSVAGLSSKFSDSSVTSRLDHRSKLDFLFQILSKPITHYKVKTKWFPSQFPNKNSEEKISELEPEESVHVEVLYDPSPVPIRADVIFIHGLHGSLFNTWKQGLWSHRKQVQNLPLEHKYNIEENTELEKEKPLEDFEERFFGDSRNRCDAQGQHDSLLENITDLLNNIDDTLKESGSERVSEDTEKEPYSPCWPRDWLPKDCPGVRVIAVNYTTDPFLWRPVWITKRIRSSMTQRSQEMEDILIKFGVGRHPIVWVGHSKGGLFVKQMLVDARSSDEPRLSSLLRQTKGIMFYSVPHRGSQLAHWNLPLLRQSVELKEVKKDCQEVLELHRRFIKLYKEKSLKAEVFSFVETILTFMWVTNVRVVSVDSADLGVGSFQGVNIDHREICKPLNRDCFLYKELTNLIDRVI